VEAFIDGTGWVTFDPTPAAGLGSGRIQDTLYRTLTRWIDGLRFVWYRYVVDFDFTNQKTLFVALMSGERGWRVINTAGSVSSAFERTARMFKPGGRNFMILMLGAAMLFILLLIAREAKRLITGLPRSTSSRRWQAEAVIIAYSSLLKRMEKLRMRGPGETPMEFARAITGAEPRLADFCGLTETYYCARFDQARWDEQLTARADALRNLVDTIERERRNPAALRPT
jgi:hypothetical protein